MKAAQRLLERLWRRRATKVDPTKLRATHEAREAIQTAARRQVEVEKVASNLRSMSTSNHFAEMLVKLLRHQG